MTTTWIVGGIAAACLVLAFATWRLRKAGGTVQRILDEERARQPEPEEPDPVVHPPRGIER